MVLRNKKMDDQNRSNQDPKVKSAAESRNHAMTAFSNFMKERFLSDKAPNGRHLSPDQYWAGMDAIFSRQGQISTPDLTYQMLTGYNRQGQRERYGHGLFSGATGFNSTNPDDTANALSTEVRRALTMGPTEAQKQNLHRAATVIGFVRQLPQNRMAEIHAAIKAAAPVAQSSPQPATYAKVAPRDYHKPLPTAADIGWSEGEFHSSAAHAARAFKTVMGQRGEHVPTDHLAEGIKQMALHAHATHGLDMATSIRAVSNALNVMYAGPVNAKKVFADQLAENAKTLTTLRMVDEEAAKLRKLDLLDDLDALMKVAWEETRHPRHARGAADGGEFAPATGGGVSLNRGVTKEPRASRAPAEEASPWSASAIATGIGSYTGMQAGWDLARKYVPGPATSAAKTTLPATAEQGVSLAAKYLPNFSVKSAIRSIPHFGAAFIASGLGEMAGSGLAEAGVRQAYAIAGKPMPSAPAPAKDPSLGEWAVGMAGATLAQDAGMATGRMVGTAAGRLIGGTVGGLAGPAGALALGAAAGYVGEQAATSLYRWLAPYPQGKSVLDRHVKAVLA